MKRTVRILSLSIILLIIVQCRFEEIDQPSSAQPGEIIELSITVYDDVVPEPNPHKGVLCMLIPEDWSFVSADYSGSLGTGQMELSPDWADSTEACYPASEMGENMNWIALISDTGYTYNDPITVTAVVTLQTGQTNGCFDLGYLVTKATPDILCSSWSPLSFPHTIGIPDSCQSNSWGYRVESAPEWTALFDRDSGWTGADGIYSIPLSGSEVPSDSSIDQTLLFFSDTFIGEVDSLGHRINSSLVNNTYALLNGTEPDPNQITFFWGIDNYGQPEAVFLPNTPNTNPGDWYWLMDGISIDGEIYIFGLRMEEGSGGLFNFQIVGVSLITCTLDSTGSLSNYEQVDAPIFYEDEGDSSAITLGQAVMPLTEVSSFPNPDGYIYIYGPRNGGSDPGVVVARVLPENFEDFSLWEYWDGQDWTSDISLCSSITDRVSQEFSVSPTEDGMFVMAFQLDGISRNVAIRYGDSPVGPFGVFHIVWTCPEVDSLPGIFTYNAKAHPHLSDPGELLISYNVNTFNFGDHFTYADIYRPRFIRLIFDDDSLYTISGQYEYPNSFSVYQNYPNPFNIATTLRYYLLERRYVRITVYDILGRQVKNLFSGYQDEGNYSIVWNAKNDLGTSVSSGVYLYQIQAGELTETRKMVLLE
ncbi:MAG: DUF4185 domain-containing protein [Bacteroidales bacterium]|nr:DUF4185 domain-containing protein [Bacteroidales bacterium]